MVVKRGVITCCNIFFPPLAVFLLTGAGEDLVINSVLFLLAVIPSHVHGFYISMTYFNRKRKIRKGQYPGPRRPMIYSEKVQNGGATASDVRQFKKGREIEKYEKAPQKKSSGRVRRFVRRITGRNTLEEQEPLRLSGEYYAGVEELERPNLSRRQSSRVRSDMPRLSRQNTRKRTSSYGPEIVDEPQMIQRHASYRSQGASRNRHSQIEYEQNSSLPRRQTSTRNSQALVDTRGQYRNDDDGEIARHSTYGGIGTNGGSIRRNRETFTDYVSRPSLPHRPGKSYRDDVNQWLQAVPDEDN